MAKRVGFEPTMELPPRRISSAGYSKNQIIFNALRIKIIVCIVIVDPKRGGFTKQRCGRIVPEECPPRP